MRKWKIGLLAVLVIALVSIGGVRRDITGRTQQQVQTAAEARTAMARAGNLEKRVQALEARVAVLEAKAAPALQPSPEVRQAPPDAKGQSRAALREAQRKANAAKRAKAARIKNAQPPRSGGGHEARGPGQ